MSLLEAITWIALGTVVGALWRAPPPAATRPWQIVASAAAALAGGALTRIFDPTGREPGGFGFWSFILAGVCAIGAMMVSSTIAERRAERRGR
jgi:hypothetical protein